MDRTRSYYIDLLRHLLRSDVREFAVATGRLPCVKISEVYEPIDDVPFTSDDVCSMLVAFGGSRYVDVLQDKPTKWNTRVEGVGALLLGAVIRKDRIQARVLLTKRDPSGVAPKAPERSQTSDVLMAALMGATGQRVTPPPPTRPSTMSAKEVAERSRVEEEDPLDHTMPLPIPRNEPPKLRAPASALAGGALAPQKANENLEADLESFHSANAPSTKEVRSVRPAVSMRAPILASNNRVPVSIDEYDHPLARALRFARISGASDLHVIAGRPLLLRVAQALTAHGPDLSPAVVETMVKPMIPPALMETFRSEGSCDFSLAHPEAGRFRANIARHRWGLKASLRVIGEEPPTFESLGLPPEVSRAAQHHQGLIVVAGPTGHGKTTTVAAIVDYLNRETTHHVITVEDPIEYVHPRKRAMLSQREIGTHTKSFQSALKASLREDPDVVVVGELRDPETVRMALSAAETGHLVLGTMNTPSAAKTIDRLIDLFPPADQPQVRVTLATTLRLIISQRLLAKVDGKGLVAAVEMLPGSFALATLIRENKTFQIPSLQQRGRAFGIIRIDDSLLELVRSGKVSPQAALFAAESPDDLAQKLGIPLAKKGV